MSERARVTVVKREVETSSQLLETRQAAAERKPREKTNSRSSCTRVYLVPGGWGDGGGDLTFVLAKGARHRGHGCIICLFFWEPGILSAGRQREGVD